MFKYYIKTFGCQMNVNDSEIIAGQMEQMNFTMTSEMNEADIIIFNTCCVRKKVEHKIYSMAGKVSQIKEKKPGVIFGICGCLAQKEAENIQIKVPSVDLIFGPSQSSSFADIFRLYYSNKNKIIYCDNRKPFRLNNISIKYTNNISAFVQIMKGCNNFCSYCIVPYTRGPEESRPIREILSEVNHLARNGYKEIFLLGQNVNSYGNDIPNHCDFLTLLSEINRINDIKRIRFTTSHPKDFNINLIKTIKNGKNICEHIHLPMQSGSDNILSRMNRKYNMKEYNNIIKQIRKIIPNASITTDVMVGFPGETNEDFENTIRAFEKIKFDSAYTFIYSNREKTLSSFFSNQIDLQTKKKRLWKLMEIQKNISININKQLIGEILEILVDSKSRKGIEYQYCGKTRTNKIVIFSVNNNNFLDNDKNNIIGKLAYCKIKHADAYTLYGELVDLKK